jgi:hypothetical protein
LKACPWGPHRMEYLCSARFCAHGHAFFRFYGDKMKKTTEKVIKRFPLWRDRLREYTEEKNKMSRQGIDLTDEVLQQLKDKWKV